MKYLNKRLEEQRERLLWYNEVASKEQDRQHVLKEVANLRKGKEQQDQELERLRAQLHGKAKKAKIEEKRLQD